MAREALALLLLLFLLLLGCAKLVNEAVELAAVFKEVGVRALLQDAALPHHDDAVALWQDVQRVCDEEAGAVGKAALGPNDVLVVPSKRIVEMDRWVDQYIAKLLLFRGVGGNVSYRLN